MPLLLRLCTLLFVTLGSLTAQGNAGRCLPCHTKEVERFEASPMGRSLSTATTEPDREFVHTKSGSTIKVFRQNGVMHHRIAEHGLTADYPIAYAIGFGNVGRSYLIDLGGHLFQSPASYFTKRSEWGPSPGYEAESILDFNRSITSDCLSCHAGTITREQGKVLLQPITCDRCHGPAENHLRSPVPGSIVNPAKLQGRLRDSICEQCHLEGATVILNPGMHWSDFRPGGALEKTETHYVYRIASGDVPSVLAVSHAEQLALSACSRNSNGKLWCGTCHDPHDAPAERRSQILRACASCHPASQIAKVHPASQTDCTGCHMPQRTAADISHAAITDHRIAAKPSLDVSSSASPSLVAWQSPDPKLANRNLGLALFKTAHRSRSGKEYEQAFRLLSSLPGEQRDPEVLGALGYMQLGVGRVSDAIAAFRRAVDQSPTGEFWLDLGVAQGAANNDSAAISSFHHSIEVEPYDYRPYLALSRLYQHLGQSTRSEHMKEEFLRLVPQSLLLRLNQN